MKLKTTIASMVIILTTWLSACDTKETNILAEKMTERWINTKSLNFSEYGKSLVFQNITKDINHLFSIIYDIDSVDIYKTSDNNDADVITIKDSKGSRVSLWLDKKGQIVSITPY